MELINRSAYYCRLLYVFHKFRTFHLEEKSVSSVSTKSSSSSSLTSIRDDTLSGGKSSAPKAEPREKRPRLSEIVKEDDLLISNYQESLVSRFDDIATRVTRLEGILFKMLEK